MKRLLLFMTCVCVILSGMAQTQSGYVKTPGRLGSNRSVIAGKRLSGATIQIKGGRTVVSSANGTFSFPIPTNKFFLQSVKKQGYVLTDPEAITRQYVYSTNPLILVLETPEQQAESKLANERKIRRTLESQLHAREDEIEELKEQISQHEYQEALRQLYEAQRTNERLIEEMVERYTQMDFDQLDEFNLQISDCILNGRLIEADSLLRSKGDMDTRIATLNQSHEANVQAREMLEKSEAMEQKDREDIAQDCYSFYQKFLMEHKSDSAARYITLRASLDEGNAQWQFDAGSFFQKRGQQQHAMEYYQKALGIVRKLTGDDAQSSQPVLAHTLNNLALFNVEHSLIEPAEANYQEALSIYKKLADEDPQGYAHYIASTLNNLAILYADSEDGFSKSENTFIEVLNTYLERAKDDPKAFMPLVASVLNNLGLLYDENGLFTSSEKMYRDALDIYRQLASSQPQVYNSDVAAALNNLSSLYHRNNVNGQLAEEMMSEAVQIYQQLADEDMSLYGPKLAVVLSNLAVQYSSQQRLDDAAAASKKEINVYQALSKAEKGNYLATLAQKAYDLGIAYFQAEEWEHCKTFFQAALDAYRQLAADDPSTYKPEVAKVLRNLATALDKGQLWKQSGDLYLEELGINQELAKVNPAQYKSDVARSYGNLSNHALLMKEFQKAVDYATQGLALDNSKIFIQANLALAHLCLGNFQLAEGIYRQYAQPLRDTFLDDLHQFTELGVIPQARQADVEAIINMLSH